MGDVGIVRYRPIKLIAVIFAAIAVLLIIIGVAAAEWVDVKFQAGDNAYQSWGLWEECYSITSALTVCLQKQWMQACAALTLVALFAAIGSVGLGIVGLCTHKRIIYIIAGVLTLLGALFILISVIIFPVKFSEEMGGLDRDNLERWDFDWTYGVTLGGLFFLLGATVFFFLKQENQEISEKSGSLPPYYVNSTHR